MAYSEHSATVKCMLVVSFKLRSSQADLYQTVFGLVVSLKLFLGRFDMRTMQVGIVQEL